MELKDTMINTFEARVMRLVTITDLTKLPQWSDTDILGADCIVKEYRRLTGVKKEVK